MHASEGKLRLGLHADGHQRLRADFARASEGVLEQRRLSNASFARDHDRPTPQVLDQSVELVGLSLTPDQLRGRAGATQSAGDARVLDMGKCSRLTQASRHSTR